MIVSNINELAPSSLYRSFGHLRRQTIIILMRKGLFAQKALGPQGLTNAWLLQNGHEMQEMRTSFG